MIEVMCRCKDCVWRKPNGLCSKTILCVNVSGKCWSKKLKKGVVK